MAKRAQLERQGEQIVVIGEAGQGGAYLLRIQVREDLEVSFGRFQGGQPIQVPAGVYVYVGSARGERGSTTLARRLLRHATRTAGAAPHSARAVMLAVLQQVGLGPQKLAPPKAKRLHWHIDHLLDSPAVEIDRAIALRSPEDLESSLAARLTDDPDTQVLFEGLGASDASKGSHLFRVPSEDSWWEQLRTAVAGKGVEGHSDGLGGVIPVVPAEPEEALQVAEPTPPVPRDPARGRVAAFVDIGTNSVRLLLVRINPNQSYTILNTEKEIVRLGEGEFVDQHLQAEAMQRAAVVCGTFSEMAQAYGAAEIIAIATSATREAENKKEFLRLLREEAGLEVRTISGMEEARLIYLGLSSGVHLNERQGVFIDIGGGSTEVIVGDQAEYHYLDSLKLGAIRLSTLFFLPEETGPVPDERFALIQQYVRNAAIRTLQRVRHYRLDLAVGSSGTIENLADIAALHFYGRRREPDDVLEYRHLEEVVRMLRALPLEARRKVPGMSPARADIIIGGAAILLTLLQELGLESIAISDRGLRDGLLEDYLRRSEHGPLVSGMSVRARSVLQFGRACNFEEGHARQVTKLALQLFDGTKAAGLHNLGKGSRELLEHAAMLHDIGSFVSHTNHQAHSNYMIRNADLLGFDQREIRMIATTAYFHRKAFPRKKHPQYRSLDKNARQIIRVLAVCLQMAESLDRSHAAVINQVRFKSLDQKKIALALEADQDCQLEIWGVRNQMRAFKRVFGRKLILEVCSEI